VIVVIEGRLPRARRRGCDGGRHRTRSLPEHGRIDVPLADGEGEARLWAAIFCTIPDIATLDARKHADHTRRRSNFEVNRKLGPALRDWYGTLDQLDPGRVEWPLPDRAPDAGRRDRYGLELFIEWMERLPGRRTGIP
jgi:hypothetical protein